MPAIRTVLLVNPPSLPGTRANREGTAGMGLTMPAPDAFFYPPQSLAYSIAVLRVAGYHALGLDAVGEMLDIPATLARVQTLQPDLIAVLVAPKTWDADQAFLHALAEALPHTPRLLIGMGARFVPHASWSPMADALLAGDPEWGLVEAVDALRDEEEAPGLWRSDVAEPPAPVRVPDRPLLPRPAWDALPVDRYPFLSLWGSRGCDASCRWCPYVVGWGRGRRTRAPEDVAEELLWLAETFGKPRHIFRDPVFAADNAWVEALCRAIRQRTHTPPAWEVEDRPEHLSASLLATMAQAGCTQVKLGLEVLSPRMLALWQRIPEERAFARYRERAAEVIRACRDLGILCRVFIVTGIGETEDDLAATEAFLHETRPHYVSVKRFVPYPGVHPPHVQVLPDEVLAVWEARLQAAAYPPRPSPWRRLRGRLARLLR